MIALVAIQWCVVGNYIAAFIALVVAGYLVSKRFRQQNFLAHVKSNRMTVVVVLGSKSGEEGVSFFDALRHVAEFNRRYGAKARLVSHKTAEALLATKRYNDDLKEHSPFWTGTLIAYESRRASNLGEVITSYHHPKDGSSLYVARFPTETFCGNTDCALTLDGVTIEDFVFDDKEHKITIRNDGRAIKTDGFPHHPEQLYQDAQTGVPSRNASDGRKLWLIRADRPVLWSGGRESEAVNPFFDNYVGPIVRSAPLADAVQADEAFAADVDFFTKCGVVMEMDEADFRKIQ